MSTATATAHDSGPANGNGGTVMVRPQVSIGALAEQQRVQAEIQSRLMVAKSCRRDEVEAVDRIKTSCQRPGLAEKSEYSYSRGGTEITGPTIDLLTVIGNCWGNIDYGFRELSQANGESHVEAFAWDLETNAKRTVAFTVPHKRYTKQGSYPLTDPRDIYETVANYAQRRVRACLEAIIPPDVVEDAVAQCRETLKASAQVTPESVSKLIDAFGKLGVTTEQLQARLGRRIDSMQPAQLIGLRRIYKSITDGMSKAGDWFSATEGEQQPKTATDAAREALTRQAGKQRQPEAPPEDVHDRPATAEEVDASVIDEARAAFNVAYEALDLRLVSKAEEELRSKPGLNEPTRAAISGLAAATRRQIEDSPSAKAKAAGKSRQRELA